MRTLRAPSIQRIPQSDAEQNGQHWPIMPSKPRQGLSTMLLLSVGIVVVVSLIIRALVGGGGSVPPSTSQPLVLATALPATVPPVRETVVVVTTPTPVPTLDCVSVESQLASIDGLIQKGQWEQAGDQAEAALSISNLCTGEVRQLIQRAVLAGLNVIYNQQFDPLDPKGQQAAVDRFLRLRERARLIGATFPTLLQVARETYRISQHRLTIAAIETAFMEDEYNPAIDRETTKLYISALYGLGYWYTQAEKGSDLYTEGLSYLVASHLLARQFKTGQAEGANLLHQLIGDNEATWPAPYDSPLFVAVKVHL